MEELIKISHQDIKQYIRQNRTKKLNDKIETIKNENTVYNFFFTIIDDLMLNNTSENKKNGPSVTFKDSEELLLKIVSNSVEPEEEGYILNLFEEQPHFYERFIIKLSQSESLVNSESPPEMEQVTMLNDDEILELMGVKQEKEEKVRKYKIDDLWGFLKNLLDFSINPFPKLAAYGTVLATLIFAIFFRTLIWQPTPLYIFDDKVPYEFDMSSLRGAVDREQSPEYQNIKNDFLMAMSDYLIFDYLNAISNFEKILSNPQPEEQLAVKIYMEARFYLAMSCLARVQSQKTDNTEQAKKELLTKAIQNLQMSRSYFKENDAEKFDRNNYFLALACYLNEDYMNAQKYIKESKPQGIFQDKIKILSRMMER